MLYVLSITCYAFRASAPLIWIGEVNNRLQRSKGLTLDFFLFKKCIIRLCFEAPFGFLTSFRLLRETVFCFSGSAGHPTSPHPFFDFSCILYDNNLFLFTQRQCPVPQSPRRCSTSTSSSPQAGERWLRMIGLFRARRASAPGTYLLPLVPLGRCTLSVCASASNGRFSQALTDCSTFTHSGVLPPRFRTLPLPLAGELQAATRLPRRKTFSSFARVTTLAVTTSFKGGWYTP